MIDPNEWERCIECLVGVVSSYFPKKHIHNFIAAFPTHLTSSHHSLQKVDLQKKEKKLSGPKSPQKQATYTKSIHQKPEISWVSPDLSSPLQHPPAPNLSRGDQRLFHLFGILVSKASPGGGKPRKPWKWIGDRVWNCTCVCV